MTNVIISITVFIVVIIVHELAHGWTALKMGDPTAKMTGRLTLNPAAHADPFGTILLPALLILANSPVIFGWARPVPVNPLNFRSRRKGMLLTSIAGPASNFCLALLFAMVIKTGVISQGTILWSFLARGLLVSLVLGIFNLMPIPPLDGANVILSVLPEKALKMFVPLERYGFIILIAVLYLGLFDRVILPFVSVVTKVLLS